MDVLRMDHYAYIYFDKAMALAKTLTRNLEGEPWYNAIRAALRKRQLESEAVSASDLAQQQVLIATELQALNRANTSVFNLLRYLRETHPPRVAGVPPIRADVTEDNLKEALMDAFKSYHPHANQARPGDPPIKFKWKYLCAEITKLLNAEWGSRYKPM